MMKMRQGVTNVVSGVAAKYKGMVFTLLDVDTAADVEINNQGEIVKAAEQVLADAHHKKMQAPISGPSSLKPTNIIKRVLAHDSTGLLNLLKINDDTPVHSDFVSTTFQFSGGPFTVFVTLDGFIITDRLEVNGAVVDDGTRSLFFSALLLHAERRMYSAGFKHTNHRGP